MSVAALGETMVKFASTYLLTRDREFQVSAKRLIGVMAVIFQEVEKGGKIQEVVAKNLFSRAELLVRENHGKSEDERSYAWLTTDFVIELNHAFRIECDTDALKAWRRRLLLIAFEGDFTRDTSLVSVRDGMFLADPSLDDWVSSGVAGFIHLTRGILPLIERFTEREVYDKLDKLSPEREAINEEFLRQMASTEEGAEGCDDVQGGGVPLDPLSRASKRLAAEILEDGSEQSDAAKSITRAGVCLKGKPSERKLVWDKMKARGLWRPVVQRWGRKVSFYSPVLCSGAELAKLYPDLQKLSIPIDSTFPERFAVDRLQEYMERPSRRQNHATMVEHLQKAQGGEAGVRCKGRLSDADLEKLKDWSRHETKLASREAAAKALTNKISGTDGCLQSRYGFAEIQGVKVRSRRYILNAGTQGLSRQLQMIVQPKVVKLDWRKCFLTLASQIMQKTNIALDHKAVEGRAFEAVTGWSDIDTKKVSALCVLFGKRNAGEEFRCPRSSVGGNFLGARSACRCGGWQQRQSGVDLRFEVVGRCGGYVHRGFGEVRAVEVREYPCASRLGIRWYWRERRGIGKRTHFLDGR